MGQKFPVLCPATVEEILHIRFLEERQTKLFF